MKGIQTHWNCNFYEGQWRVSHAPHDMKGIQTHLKMYSPAGWRVSHAPLGACLLSRPEAKVGQWTRCFRTICWKPRHAGSTSTMRPTFGNMSPEGCNLIMWFRNSDWVSIHRRWFVLNRPRGLWLFSSRGCIPSHSFAHEQDTLL